MAKARPAQCETCMADLERGSAICYQCQAPVLEPPPVAKAETGDSMKKDHGKDPWHLAPYDAFLAIVRVLAFGAIKYRERGWEEGMAWSRVYSACMRHLTDWFHKRDKGKGPGKDADTGYSDLWHAGCCVCFLIAYEMRGMIAHDDRPICARCRGTGWAPTLEPEGSLLRENKDVKEPCPACTKRV